MRGDERTRLIKSGGELVVVTGSRITVIDASEHALGLNTPSRDTAPTKDHLNYCHQEYFAGFFRSRLRNWARAVCQSLQYATMQLCSASVCCTKDLNAASKLQI